MNTETKDRQWGSRKRNLPAMQLDNHANQNTISYGALVATMNKGLIKKGLRNVLWKMLLIVSQCSVSFIHHLLEIPANDSMLSSAPLPSYRWCAVGAFSYDGLLHFGLCRTHIQGLERANGRYIALSSIVRQRGHECLKVCHQPLVATGFLVAIFVSS